MSQYQKTFTERVFHAVSFEVIAIAITAPLSAWVLGRSIFQMGTVAIVLSTLAMLLNLFYNMIFDRYWPLIKGLRPTKIRVMHAIGFELSFVIIGLPILAFLLNMSLWNAFLLEVGFFAFFLFYTYAFNLSYDKLRENWFNRKEKRVIARQ
ncbi:multidrug/biocide efflux PACE transporter [Proteus cibarius]|uniref:Multidrug/biocide efflux PACE transporter n=1 Tax=Proteus terrae subsp. cibarius TaxID=626774 RepID=A0A6I6FM10_9GAMM|nr:multidrug/biocide efflux PACE transporter [Proteus terrae]QHP75923.1 multidrug/biocide efflux PACE transporter [Proteus vulgaris]MBG2914834.1 multidrug/biocide efflux PACE transporter [Proteus terrae subsp. cibarius]MBG3089445.1 multidrug/biocide efflux PACE transporter [Proteus terrae subsp. cibarius]MBG6039277.1 multidrug/biocide efflux PACE transporter [Proteus terrae subsp. cibarius]MCO4181107.1 multidrug/biocide efflux PACE transporter [Proteus terrae]